jgi:AcrR family transcriptional regulator
MQENIYNKRKQKIIDAAIEVIKEKSIEEATMREIAAKAGLTTGSIYHHYKNKDELFYDVVNQSIHFSLKLSNSSGAKTKNQEEMLKEIQNEVALRMSKIDEQKLHVLLLSDVISKDGELKQKYNANYYNIINRVADLYYYAFGVENEDLKRSISSIFIAALDGIAIQQSLGVLPENQEKYTKIVIDFFTECIPLFLKLHMVNDNSQTK